ncbi:deleted in malignant brain tumors 1 protein-like, partial [Branchiostoma floridae]|uniref:Deleted in malignant brain tumors 1 protein-like n=1 Tax=Branchiostoma floridae TaxID=7739 RepID=A0A9J7KTF2_BRAFL
IVSDIRLVGGSGDHEGRVEVFSEGQWGTVCDDVWGQEDAEVVCRQLGFPGAEKAKTEASFGQGSGQIWLDDVQCSGSESRLQNCSHGGWGSHNCGHEEDAGVVCKRNIRLAGGLNDHDGRVEVFYNGQWGTICDDGWGLSDAEVACRQLGFPDAGAVQTTTEASFGQGTGPIWLEEVACSGSESSVHNCSHRGWGHHDCTHGEDAGVVCNLRVRLAGGSHDHEGRVEVYHDGEWGTVCGFGWGHSNADVACRQLGFAAALKATQNSFGRGTGRVWLSNVACSGTESRLPDCSHRGWYNNPSWCGHGYDAGAVCTSLRLVGGSTEHEGRVEVYHDGKWGSICDDGFGLSDAEVVCRHLGFPGAEGVPSGASFGEGTGPIWLNDVDCDGNETNLQNCSHGGWGRHNCGHEEDAGVVCSTRVRLVGGSNDHEGRVEVYHDGEWGTVCDYGWGQPDADVTCRQLGFAAARKATQKAFFGQGTGRVWLSYVGCSGTESRLQDCSHRGWGNNPSGCRHDDDAGAVCTSLRLVGGSTEHEGRVEVYHDGKWGSICDDGFGLSDAEVVCRHLGFPGAEGVPSGASFGEGTGPIWLDDVDCDGNEPNLQNCSHGGWGSHNCGHEEDAGVACTDSVRLVGGSGEHEGRVELYYDGQWGTVCGRDWYWYRREANVVCRQLGFHGAQQITRGSFGAGTGPIWRVYHGCSRSESSLQGCSLWRYDGCGHDNDAGVVCTHPESEVVQTTVQTTLMTTQLLWTFQEEPTLPGDDGLQRSALQGGLSNEARGYALHLPSLGYTGDAGNAMRYNDGQRFSTVDRDNDDYYYFNDNDVDYNIYYSDSCSRRYGQGGWWFANWCPPYPNGRYLGNCGNSCPWGQGVMWHGWRGRRYSLKSVTMKIRP